MELYIKIGLWYILIGTIITATYDYLQQYVVKKEHLIFTNWERISIILLWPIILIIAFLRRKNQQNDE